MALLDFLKKKEEAKKAKKPEKVSNTKKAEKKPEEAKKDSTVKTRTGKAKVFSYEAVRQPHISEKGSYLAEKDQYIFKVSPSYNKKEIQNAVEGIYNVNVLSVNIVKIPAKKRRLGRTEGFRKAYKKAIVKIKNGQKIEIL